MSIEATEIATRQRSHFGYRYRCCGSQDKECLLKEQCPFAMYSTYLWSKKNFLPPHIWCHHACSMHRSRECWQWLLVTQSNICLQTNTLTNEYPNIFAMSVLALLRMTTRYYSVYTKHGKIYTLGKKESSFILPCTGTCFWKICRHHIS